MMYQPRCFRKGKPLIKQTLCNSKARFHCEWRELWKVQKFRIQTRTIVASRIDVHTFTLPKVTSDTSRTLYTRKPKIPGNKLRRNRWRLHKSFTPNAYRNTGRTSKRNKDKVQTKKEYKKFVKTLAFSTDCSRENHSKIFETKLNFPTFAPTKLS